MFLQDIKDSLHKVSRSSIRWLWLVVILVIYWITCCQGTLAFFGNQLLNSISTALLMITLILLKDQNWLAGLTTIALFISQLPHMFPLNNRQWLTTIIPWLIMLMLIAIPLCMHRQNWEKEKVSELTKKQFSLVIGIVIIETLVSFYIIAPILGNVSFLAGLRHMNMTVTFMQHTLIILAEAWSWACGAYLLLYKIRDGWLFMMVPQIGSLILNNGQIFNANLGCFITLIICICAYINKDWQS